MNSIVATVQDIHNVDNLNIVKFDFSGTTLSMISLELNSNITVGSKVKLTAKPTYIALAKEFNGDISYSNQLQTKILNIENGELLSSIKIEIHNTVLESIITRESSNRMNLNIDDTVTAFIKANEISVMEIL